MLEWGLGRRVGPYECQLFCSGLKLKFLSRCRCPWLIRLCLVEFSSHVSGPGLSACVRARRAWERTPLSLFHARSSFPCGRSFFNSSSFCQSFIQFYVCVIFGPCKLASISSTGTLSLLVPHVLRVFSLVVEWRHSHSALSVSCIRKKGYTVCHELLPAVSCCRAACWRISFWFVCTLQRNAGNSDGPGQEFLTCWQLDVVEV